MKMDQTCCLFYAFFALCGVLFAQEKRVEIVFKDGTSIKGVLLNYGERTYQIQINGKIQTFSEKDIQRVLFEENNGSTNKENSVSTEATESTLSKNGELMKNLEAKVTLDFNETPIGEVLNFLQVVANLNMVIESDVALETPITLTVMDIDMKTVLSLLKLLAPIAIGVKGNVLIISKSSSYNPAILDVTPAEVCPLEAIEKRHPEIFQKLRSTKMTLNFSETPIADVISFLRDVSGQNIFIHPIALKPRFEKKLSLDMIAHDLDFYAVLQLIESVMNLEFVLVNQEVLVLTLRISPDAPAKDSDELFYQIASISKQLRESIIASDSAQELKALEKKLKAEVEEITVLREKENSQEVEARTKRLKELRKKYELQSMDWLKKYNSPEMMKEKYQIAVESFLKMQQKIQQKDEELYKVLEKEELEYFWSAWKDAEVLYQELKKAQK